MRDVSSRRAVVLSLCIIFIIHARRVDALSSASGARRREIRARYADAFADLPIRFLGRDAEGRDDSEDNCWLTTVVVDPTLAEVRGRPRPSLEGQ